MEQPQTKQPFYFSWISMRKIEREKNNTSVHAFNLGSLSSSSDLRGSIGERDRTDYFRFKLGQRSSLNVKLSQQHSPIKLQLLSHKQQPLQVTRDRSSPKNPNIHAVLEPGTYFLRLTASGKTARKTAYQLRFSQQADDHSPLSTASPSNQLANENDGSSQSYKFKYSYGNGDYYTGYGYAQPSTYKQGQNLSDDVVNETGLKGNYKILSVQNNSNTANINKVFVDYYYDIERKSGYKPYSGSGTTGLGSELGYLDPRDRSTYFGGKFYEADTPILLGVSTGDYWGNQSVVENQLNKLGNLTGKRLSIGSLFMDIEDRNPAYNIPTQLNNLQNDGYTGFIHLMSHQKLENILNGSLDPALERLAKAYANWATQDTNHSAWIAPLPEMNGTWEPYSGDAQSFKQTYRHIQDIFKTAGVPAQSVRWVFAPNGWSPSDRSFETFYPGADAVDAVSFSAFNWGYADTAAYKRWQTPTQAFDPYVQRLRKLAPDKPIFITQMGTTSVTATGSSPEAKSKWLKDAYTYFTNAPGIRGVLYFNLNKETDWSLFSSNGQLYSGYQTAIQSPAYDYIAPAELAQTQLIPNLPA
jgi:Glycosyl hydrolase family 26